ncbi:MAG: ATP-binding protein, partial [Pseudomonadota bacterium]
RAFSASVVTGAQEQLRLVIYSLMGTVGEQDDKLTFNAILFEPRLSQPDSGLYARVTGDLGEELWLSASAVTTAVEFPDIENQPGAFVFVETAAPIPRFHLSYTVIWEGVDTDMVVFSTATDQAPYRAAIAEFRRSLSLGLGAATLFFIIAQLAALRWGLLPLRKMAGEVRELEAGEREQLSDAYPRELTGLAANLDRFVAHEKDRRSRYRHALEDLAHSLKTPLAVVRNSLLGDVPDKPLLQEQLQRMETTVTHQLSKASATGPVVVGKAVIIDELVQRLVRALQTAYADKQVQVSTQLQNGLAARGDERDFLEMLGNLLENAFKYGVSKVHVTSRLVQQGETQLAQICVADDGPGIPAALRAEVLNRGHRLDEIQSGQGIGLAVVAELVGLYQGQLDITESAHGGAAVVVNLPV